MNIKILWVGAALTPDLENTYFLITAWKNNLQVDSSWWLTFAQKIRRKEIYFENIFFTHCYTDHFLGFFNMLRIIGIENPKLNVYYFKQVEKILRLLHHLFYENEVKKTCRLNCEWLILES